MIRPCDSILFLNETAPAIRYTAEAVHRRQTLGVEGDGVDWILNAKTCSLLFKKNRRRCIISPEFRTDLERDCAASYG